MQVFITHRRRNQGGTGGTCPPKFSVCSIYVLYYKVIYYILCPPPPPIKKSFLRLCYHQFPVYKYRGESLEIDMYTLHSCMMGLGTRLTLIDALHLKCCYNNHDTV